MRLDIIFLLGLLAEAVLLIATRPGTDDCRWGEENTFERATFAGLASAAYTVLDK